MANDVKLYVDNSFSMSLGPTAADRPMRELVTPYELVVSARRASEC